MPLVPLVTSAIFPSSLPIYIAVSNCCWFVFWVAGVKSNAFLPKPFAQRCFAGSLVSSSFFFFLIALEFMTDHSRKKELLTDCSKKELNEILAEIGQGLSAEASAEEGVRPYPA
jgi:hypothetical protein